MSKLIINGGKALRGTTTPVPNKNSIIKLIPACVLTSEPVMLHNVPQTSDVKYMLEIFQKLGGSFEWLSNDTVRVDGSGIYETQIDAVLSVKMKASVMFAGPLLARFGEVTMPTPQ
jgi:UDP-N-acetylglucosamine 1-carboxyvinyltransferase